MRARQMQPNEETLCTEQERKVAHLKHRWFCWLGDVLLFGGSRRRRGCGHRWFATIDKKRLSWRAQF
jgi:hypothetical protein